ncbi:hypothetical protein CUC08_Gglean009364 [Alternaria sp. MG1]|jgi:hypothetical protein|nr:hypothetical protein CUC08_Gglean009364 [Alternaria sp. MG1]RYO02304.1 hypothetical protein AA0120_g464 [Alternaria tenuissima]
MWMPGYMRASQKVANATLSMGMARAPALAPSSAAEVYLAFQPMQHPKYFCYYRDYRAALDAHAKDFQLLQHPHASATPFSLAAAKICSCILLDLLDPPPDFWVQKKAKHLLSCVCSRDWDILIVPSNVNVCSHTS